MGMSMSEIDEEDPMANSYQQDVEASGWLVGRSSFALFACTVLREKLQLLCNLILLVHLMVTNCAEW